VRVQPGHSPIDAGVRLVDAPAAVDRADKVLLVIPPVAAIAAACMLAATGTVIDGSHYVHHDVLLRDANVEHFAPYRTLDPSPFMIWAPGHHDLCQAVRQGSLPWWSRAQGGGFSPVRKIYLGVFFPLRWLSCAWPLPQAHSAFLLLGLAMALMATFYAFRRFGRGRLASVIGAVVFSATGPVISFLWFDGLHAFALAPLLLLACRLGRPIHVAVGLALLILAGHPSYVLTIAVAVVAALGAAPWRRPSRLGGLAVAAVIGVGLAWFAVQPFLHEVIEGTSYKRHGGGSFVAERMSVWLRWLVSAVFPRRAPAVDDARFFTYVGIVPVVLAALGWRQVERRWRVAFVVGFLLFMPGPWMAPVGWLPILSLPKAWYYAPAFALPLAYLTAAGVDAKLADRSRLVQAVVCVLLVLGIGWPLRDVYRPVEYAEPRSDALAVLADGHRAVGLGGHALAPNTATLLGVEDVAIVSPVLDRRWDAWYRLAARSSPADGTLRFLGATDSPLPGAFNVRWYVRSTRPHDPLLTAIAPGPPSRRRRRHPPAPTWPLRYANEHVEIYERTRDLRPRAYLSTSAHAVADFDAARAWIAEDDTRLRTTDVVESPQSVATGPGTAKVRYPPSGDVVIDTDAARASLLVLNDRYERGWTATVDGVAAPVRPVNIIARGVEVPAGQHTVVMRYRPEGLVRGAMVSLAALLVLLGWIFLRRAKR